MTNEVITAPLESTVAEVNAHIQDQLRGPDFVYLFYIVDDEDSRRLCGVMTLRDLHVADPQLPIAQIIAGAVVALIPGLPVFVLLVGIQALNGVLLPAILTFIPKLINDRRLVGDSPTVGSITSWRGQPRLS